MVEEYFKDFLRWDTVTALLSVKLDFCQKNLSSQILHGAYINSHKELKDKLNLSNLSFCKTE